MSSPADPNSFNKLSSTAATSSWTNYYQPSHAFANCSCESCVEMRRQAVSPDTLYNQLVESYRAVSMLQSRSEIQEFRIVKLEELVKCLVKALGVNEEFLTSTYKGDA